MPHTLNTTNKETRILVGVCPKGLKWDMNTVDIVLVLVVNSNDRNEFKNLFQNVVSIFTSKTWSESHKKINDYNYFINLVQNTFVKG